MNPTVYSGAMAYPSSRYSGPVRAWASSGIHTFVRRTPATASRAVMVCIDPMMISAPGSVTAHASSGRSAISTVYRTPNPASRSASCLMSRRRWAVTVAVLPLAAARRASSAMTLDLPAPHGATMHGRVRPRRRAVGRRTSTAFVW